MGQGDAAAQEHPDGFGSLGSAAHDIGRHPDGAAHLRLLRLPRSPAPGAPELAARVRDLLRHNSLAVVDDPARGLDHGAYVPLVAMYPDADVPVLQISMPGLDAHELFQLGQALAPLRNEGVLVFGSGFLTHNMRYAFRPGIPPWAKQFDAWTADALLRFDVDALMDFQVRAPAAKMALPTWEHYAPVLVAAGAVGNRRPTTIHQAIGPVRLSVTASRFLPPATTIY